MIKKLNMLTSAVLLIAILTAGLASFQAISRFNDQNNRAYLISAGQMISQQLADRIPADRAVARTLEAFSHNQKTLRATIVDTRGNVVFDNEADSSQMDNHLFRAEIALAIKGEGPGFAIRRSNTLDTEMIYVAQLVPELDLVVRTSMPVYTSQGPLRDMLLAIGLVLLLALAVLILISALSTRWITRPLQALNAAARAISTGDYTVRLHQLDQDDNEAAVLGEAFNSMADRLQQTITDLEERNERLAVIFENMSDPLLVVNETGAVILLNSRAKAVFGRDLDPARVTYPLVLLTHSEATDALVRQAIEGGQTIRRELPLQTVTGAAVFLVIASPVRTADDPGAILTLHDITEMKRLQKLRSDFVANVTHELKTPLTSIRGFVETLRAGAARKPDVADRFLAFIDIEAERLHKLIQDILILSEIEEIHADPHSQTFDLQTLVDAVAVLLDDAASAAGISIVVEENDSPLTVSANPDRIKQVLINLVDNAIKYNQPGGKVYIQTGRQDNGLVAISVRDTGVGIEPEHQARIFERFYRVDKSRSRDLGGTGLGLSIVKHIAQLYDGYATVESKPGQGSDFQVFLKI
jgi:two-component system phosphate regulon sensor histidine kinase PhoR